MSWELIIRMVENGFVCAYKEEIEDDKFIEREHLIIENDNINEDEHFNENKTMTELLWYVMEYFGIHTDKHEKSRIDITLQKRVWDEKKEDWGQWKNASEN